LDIAGVDKEQFKIKLLQKMYSVEWTFTQKQIPRQNEKLYLVSVNFNTKDRGASKSTRSVAIATFVTVVNWALVT